jgi:hypothetical protein
MEEQPKGKPGRKPGAYKTHPHSKLARLTPEQLRQFEALLQHRQRQRASYREADLLRDLVTEAAAREGVG